MTLFNKKIIGVLGLLLLGSPAVMALQAASPQLASTTHLGLPADGPCERPRLSQNGRFLTFYCLSGDVVPDDDNDRYDTFLVDRLNTTTRRVSFNAENQEQESHSGIGFASDTGTQVVFDGQGMFHPDVVFVSTDTPDYETQNVFLRDMTAHTTGLLSRAQDGEGNPERQGAMLLDALTSHHEVLFASVADYVGDRGPAPPTSSIQEIYTRNWQTGDVERISSRPDGTRSNRTAGLGSYSNDGRYVVFASRASDITNDNPQQKSQLFLRDRATGMTERVSRPWQGGEFSSVPFESPFYITPRVTAGGRYVVFSASLNDEFTPDDNPGVGDTYLIDRHVGTTELVSRTYNSVPADGAAFDVDVSADGRVISFFSRASNMLPGAPAHPAVYVKDRLTGELINISLSLGKPKPLFTPQVDLSADGRTVAFSWRGDEPGQPEVRDRIVVYTVQLRGFETPRAISPVPAGSLISWTTLAGLLALLGAGRLMSKSSARCSF